MQASSFLHPRRVFTTPASVGSSGFAEPDPEQDQLINPYAEHPNVDEYYYGAHNNSHTDHASLSIYGTDMHYSDMGTTENDMPYLEPEYAYSKEAWSATMPSDEDPNQTQTRLLGASENMTQEILEPTAYYTQNMPDRCSVYDDDEEKRIIHYGHIPQRQPRRYRTIKRVPLHDLSLIHI